MTYDFEHFDHLPLWGKMSYTGYHWCTRTKSRGCRYVDWDCSNQARNRFRNMRSKNAKAKHRKKFKR